MTFSAVSVSIFLSPEPHPSEQRRHWTLDSSIRREKSTGGWAGQLQTAEVWRPRVEAGVHVGTRGQTRGGGAGPDIVTNCYTQKSEIIRLQRWAQVAATPVVSCLSSPRGSLLTSQSQMITKIVTIHNPHGQESQYHYQYATIFLVLQPWQEEQSCIWPWFIQNKFTGF